MDVIRQQLHLGQHIGLECADECRFKAGSWQSGSMIASSHEAQVVAQVERFLTDHPSDYGTSSCPTTIPSAGNSEARCLGMRPTPNAIANRLFLCASGLNIQIGESTA